MIKVYGDMKSGNCYKIKLLLHLLELEYEWIFVDTMAGGTRTDEFTARNPNQKIPVVQLDNGEYLSESNAILYYLADGSGWLPSDRLQRARVIQWQCFEQYSHEPFIAVARFIALYLGLPEDRRADYEAKQQGGHRALGIMDRQLGKQDYLVGDIPSIADISLYAYTHVAHEGGFDLGLYPNVQAWIQRIQSLPNYCSMED
ncbi:MAG: glutathione S-transferase family protein [Gammaproteobacteria bacterium]